MNDERRYLFHPLERRGVLLGLTAPQLATIAGGVLAGFVATTIVPGDGGLVACLAVLAVAAAVACLPVAGRPPVLWAPIAVSWLGRSRLGARSDAANKGFVAPSSPLAVGPGRPLVRSSPYRGQLGMPLPGGVRRRRAIVQVPAGLRAPGEGSFHRRRQDSGPRRSTIPPGIRLVQAPAVPGEDTFGVVRDLNAGTYGAVVPVESRSFPLLGPDDKERRLSSWASVLAALGRAGSPVHRIQWVESTAEGDDDELDQYFRCHAAPADAEKFPRARASYESLVSRAGPASVNHDVLLFVSVSPRMAGRALRAFGRGERGAAGLLRRELRLLHGQLRGAELTPGPPLEIERLESAIRASFDSVRRRRPVPSRPPLDGGIGQEGGQGAPPAPLSSAVGWPMATRDTWSHIRVDGTFHTIFWVSEWPRFQVGTDFLAPLMLTACKRTVSLVMSPVPPARAAREVESARTADLADAELRKRAGFVATARRRREAEGVTRREAELADGHTELRFSGYVRVTANDVEALESAAAEVEQAAQQSHLELRRLYGQQEQAFHWTLPIGRGLA